MYADIESRAGVLEPEGIVEIKSMSLHICFFTSVANL